MSCPDNDFFCAPNCGSLQNCEARMGQNHNRPFISWICPNDANGAPGQMVSARFTAAGGASDILSCVTTPMCTTGAAAIAFQSPGIAHPGQAGSCADNGGGDAVASCAANGGIQGFLGAAGSRIDNLSLVCADGTQVATVSQGPGGTVNVPPQTAPSTHYLVGLRGDTDGDDDDRVTDLTFQYQPLTNFCRGTNLTDPRCISFCKNHPGECDANLLAFCANSANFDNPVCGCALPSSQYPISALNIQTGLGIPIACDGRCQGTSSIPLVNTGTCNVGAICVQNDIDISAVSSTIGSGITLEQNCGGTGPIGGGGSGLNIDTTLLFFIAAGALLLFIVVLVLAILLSGASKRSSERRLAAAL